MADRTSAEVFGEVFRLIHDHVPAGETRDRLATRFWVMSRKHDFHDSLMACDDVLVALGLAHRAVDLHDPERGEKVVYEPFAGREPR